MKLRVTALNGKALTKCLFIETKTIGSESCKRCKYNRSSKPTFIDCGKVDEMVNAINTVMLDEEADLKVVPNNKSGSIETSSTISNSFKYTIGEKTTPKVETIENIISCYENMFLKKFPTGDIHTFLNKSRRNRSNLKEYIFGVGTEFDSAYNLRQFLFDRKLLGQVLNLFRIEHIPGDQ